MYSKELASQEATFCLVCQVICIIIAPKENLNFKSVIVRNKKYVSTLWVNNKNDNNWVAMTENKKCRFHPSLIWIDTVLNVF